MRCEASPARPEGSTLEPRSRAKDVDKESVARPLQEEFRSALREQSEMKFLRATVPLG